MGWLCFNSSHFKSKLTSINSNNTNVHFLCPPVATNGWCPLRTQQMQTFGGQTLIFYGCKNLMVSHYITSISLFLSSIYICNWFNYLCLSLHGLLPFSPRNEMNRNRNHSCKNGYLSIQQNRNCPHGGLFRK